MRASEPAREGGASAGTPAICVLASGSRGNCTAVRLEGGRVILLDAGLSPKRTAGLLREVGLSLARVTDMVFTHLDHDHCHPGWAATAKGGGAPNALVHVHRAHRGRAERMGLLHRRSRVFEEAVRLIEHVDGWHERVRIDAALASHDSLGVAAFRVCFTWNTGESSLGFATDLGHVPGAIVEHLRGVDALAIESNYCPDLQVASDRPEFLKRRIMGGSGHLSNQECAAAVRRIAPASGGPVVLLHLSEECNTPERASAGLAGSPWKVIPSSQRTPTGWIPVERMRPAPVPAPAPTSIEVEPIPATLWA